MNKTILKTSISIGLAIVLMAVGNMALADTITGNLSTGISGTNGNQVNGVVIVAPTASPAGGVFTSAQNVTLVAQGSSKIYYTLNDVTPPTCATGTLYSGAISIDSSTVIEAIACYIDDQNNVHPSTVASNQYGINPPSQVTTNNTGGGGGNTGGGGGSTSSGGGSGTVGIADFVLLMANWGQTGANNAADFNHDGTVGIQDFIWLMANWTA
jgi:uncharacterized membrane protein YgcG